AEDGIRDKLVTGVQTCALPISAGLCSCCGGECFRFRRCWNHCSFSRLSGVLAFLELVDQFLPRLKTLVGRFRNRLHDERAQRGRSEERRVGKECRSRWWPYGGQ